MGALPPNPRRSAGETPATLPTGSGVAALFLHMQNDNMILALTSTKSRKLQPQQLKMGQFY